MYCFLETDYCRYIIFKSTQLVLILRPFYLVHCFSPQGNLKNNFVLTKFKKRDDFIEQTDFFVVLVVSVPFLTAHKVECLE